MRKRLLFCLFVFGALFFYSLAGNLKAQDTSPEVQEAEEKVEKAAPPSNAITSPYKDAGPGEKRKIDIAFDNIDIYPVLDLVLSQILEANYVVDPAIKGTISINLKGSFSEDELLNIFNSVLQLHGIAIVEGEHKLFKVIRKPESAKVGASVFKDGRRKEHPGGDVISVFQLKYLSAQQAMNNLKNFVSTGAVIVSEPSINAIILADTAENVAKISRLLTLIDADLFKDIHWKLFTMEHTDVESIAKDLEKILQNKGLYGKKGLDEGAFQVLPLKTINAVMVVTKWPELIDVIGVWIEELDTAGSGKGPQVYVYFVQNGKAKDMSDLLSQVFGLKKTTSKAEKDKKTVLVTGEKEEKKEKEKPAPKAESLPGEAGEVAKDVVIIPDEVNNAILIKARPGDYETIAKILKKIDVVPRQVLIDVLILEVSLTDDIEYGVEWFLKNKGIRIGPRSYDGFMTLDQGITASPTTPLGEGISGFAYSLFDSEGGLRALVTAIADTTKVNVLSSPNILAVDNQESKIEVGEEVPTLSGSTVTDVGTTQLVQYKNTGVILKVKPYINSSGLVRMEISQEISSVISETTGNIDSPRFRSRKATTYIVADDDQTIVMGGLMQTQKERTTAGIPLLKDIPILGYAFGMKSFKTDKTELIFIITPHVIQSREQADLLTKEFAERVESLKEILEKHKKIELKGDEEKKVSPSAEVKPMSEEEKKEAHEARPEKNASVQPSETETGSVTELSKETKKGERNYFILQVSSYKDIAMASQEVSRWKEKGYDAQYVKADLGQKGIWYRVYIGKFNTSEEAKSFQKIITKKEGINSNILTLTQ